MMISGFVLLAWMAALAAGVQVLTAPEIEKRHLVAVVLAIIAVLCALA